jgi:hypothetical protein
VSSQTVTENTRLRGRPPVTFLLQGDSSINGISTGRNPLVPEKKVTAAALAGASVTIIIWILRLANVDVPAEVAAAITTILAAAAGYLAPHTHRPDLAPPPVKPVQEGTTGT